MIATKIIDTNVILVANGQHHDVSPSCRAECALALQTIMQKGRFAIDDKFLILSEYQNKTQPKIGNRPGDAFVKWALQNNANKAKCDRVPLKQDSGRGFESFPDDSKLNKFDEPDRKFVAVSASHAEHPPIVEAADSKWLDWAPTLQKYGIEVEFICKTDIERFHRNKFGT
jgi:hypothetical protein